jgi:hypothetical protein
MDRATDAFAQMTDHDMYVFFNNDHGGAAIRDATAFGKLATRRGIAVSRYPDPEEPADRKNSLRHRPAAA